VARLHSNGEFARKIERLFEGDYKLAFHLAPPLLARKDPLTGEPRKIRFGAWTTTLFRLLAALKGLRGTALDPFGRSEERRTERALIGEYEQAVEELLEALTQRNHADAVRIASIPEDIRGFGHVKLRSVAAARAKQAALLASWRTPAPAERRAAA
jgi:indolepyruvate ferredoxin oxidoreductase